MSGKQDSSTDCFDVQDIVEVIGKTNKEELFKSFSVEFLMMSARKQFQSTERNHSFAKFAVRNCLNVFHNLIETGGTIYSQDKDTGLSKARVKC